jgi:hypothetical protein
MLYYSNYLKYKKKYLQLKNQSTFIKNHYHVGGHQKVIYPSKFLMLLPNDSYTNYLKNFINYLSTNSDINNLWMIIGAINKNKHGFTDLTRFSCDYDITITGNYLINFKEPNLLSLYTCDEDIQKIGLTKDEKVYDSLNVKNIYELLAKYLPNKFEKIIYDWSTTKFILENDKIFSELEIIKNLIGLNGKLYIDTLGYMGVSILSFSTDDKKNYYIDDPIYDPITNTSTPFKITPETKEKYLKYNSNIVFYFNDERIYDPIILFQYMQSNGSITIQKIIEHLTNSEIHRQNEISKFNEETMRRLNKIFSDKKFLISYKKDIEYPNNPDDPRKKINNFYLITRIA